MKSLTMVKEIQIPNGHLATLNYILSRLTDKCKLFILAIKKNRVTSVGTMSARQHSKV